MVTFIKQNSPEVRKKLEQAGFSICTCASFDDSVWLDYHPGSEYISDIHGIGYTDEVEGLLDLTPEERVEKLLSRPDYFDKDREFFDTVEEFLDKYNK